MTEFLTTRTPRRPGIREEMMLVPILLFMNLTPHCLGWCWPYSGWVSLSQTSLQTHSQTYPELCLLNMCKCMYVCMCMYMQRPEINIQYIQYILTLCPSQFLGQNFMECGYMDSQASQPSPQASLVSAYPAFGFTGTCYCTLILCGGLGPNHVLVWQTLANYTISTTP